MTHRDRTQSHYRGGKTGGRPAARSRRYLAPVVRHVLLTAVAIAFLVPFYWMLISALKDNSQIFARPLQWWPHPVQWDNVLRALHYPGFPFLRFLWNSVFYAGCVSLGTVLSCAAVGYGFARLHFPGRDLLFAITVSTMLIPGVVIFSWAWHEFFGPLIYLSDRSQYPLSLGLFAFRAQHTTAWSLLMAASMLATLPLVVLFFCMQRAFLEGMTLTGLKGS